MSEPAPEEELMSRDHLDELLDASAPAARTIETRDVRAMLADARHEVSVWKPVRRRALISGALMVLLVGGAGVATASSDWLWGEGLENPDRSYMFTAPTWGQCEIRFSGLETHNVFTQANVDRIVDEWFATADVEAEAAPFVDKYLAVLKDAQSDDPAMQSDSRAGDLNAWTAHEQALAEALHNELRAHGFDSGSLAGAESHSQLHCDGENWGGEGDAQ